MKKVLFVLLAIVAIASTPIEAKAISGTPVGCWSFMDESEPDTAIANGELQDTLVVIYRTDYDSLILCPKGDGILEYRITKRFVAITEDGFEKMFEYVDEYSIRFKWKYSKHEIQILACYPDVSCSHVERTFDNKGTNFPSYFNNTFDEDAADYMINLLPKLRFVYNPENPENVRLYSRGYKSYFRHCKGKPTIPTQKVTII